MADAREAIARSLCKSDGCKHGEDCLCGWSWTSYLKEADAILAALSAAGLVIVPKDPTNSQALEAYRFEMFIEQ